MAIIEEIVLMDCILKTSLIELIIRLNRVKQVSDQDSLPPEKVC